METLALGLWREAMAQQVPLESRVRRPWPPPPLYSAPLGRGAPAEIEK